MLVAAGRSTRMREASPNSVRKPLIELEGRTILELAAAAFHPVDEVVEIVIVAHPDDVERVEQLVGQRAAFAKVVAVVPGGAERTDSVRLGARAKGSGSELDVLAVHDAARPFVASETIREAIGAAAEHGASVVAIPARDTVKRSTDGEQVTDTLDRRELWLAQTPQCFRAKPFLELLERAEREALKPTDDAALWERYVGGVRIVRGSTRNTKITGPEDLALAQLLLDGNSGGGTGAGS